MAIRAAAVAGAFYEAEEDCLRRQIESLLETSSAKTTHRPQALIVPHAGYIYSGATAAQAYLTLGPLTDVIERVVLFGPAHRVSLDGMAVPDSTAFTTPLGDVPVDREMVHDASTLPGVCTSNEAHRLEHSLEVQLPFLQTVLRKFSLIPIVVGHCVPALVAQMVDALWRGPETLIVVSTDLSHFHSYQQARARDAQTCSRLLNKDTSLNGHDACGAHALNGLMSSAHCRDLAVQQLALCNSGDTAGDRNRVVGYGAFILH